MRTCLIILACLCLASCGARSIDRVTFPPVSKDSIVLVDDLPIAATLTGRVEGLSCASGPLSPPPTNAEALDRMKQQAADMGATGVFHVRYKTLGISPFKGCWSGVNASGVAYHIKGN